MTSPPEASSDDDLIHLLYRALKTWGQCGCQYARDKRGVPTYSGIPIEREQISKCSRCAAMEEYERTYPERISK